MRYDAKSVGIQEIVGEFRNNIVHPFFPIGMLR